MIHPLNVASILVDLRMDPDAVIAALLHDVLEDTDARRADLRKEFGREVEALVQGVTKISILRGRTRSSQHAETIRKMLFAMVKDLRVILIKLADKLHNMRTLGYLGEEDRKRIAQETLDIYAPLAGRLGISRIKDELEDLSLKHLQPQVYDQIRQFVAARKSDRDGYLARVSEAITREAAAAGIPVTLETRAKHFYSIYQKMRRRAKPLEEIYDLLGILERLVPWRGPYRHAEGNSPAHAKATLVGASQTIAVEDGRLVLGTWQGVYFCEFDGPRRRTVHVRILAGPFKEEAPR